MTTAGEQEEWSARLRDAVAATVAARRARAEQRAWFAERRRHGLAQRHGLKLARYARQQRGGNV